MIHSIAATMAKEGIKQIYRLDCATHNVANVNTPGFKAERIFFLDNGSRDDSMENPVLRVDYSPGVIQQTGNVLDIAVGGRGFFVIETKQGEVYTRDGRFTLNDNKELITVAGDYVLGKSGKITISGDRIHINENGAISVDGNEIDTLKIVEFERPAVLKSVGMGLFRDSRNTAGPRIMKTPEIHSGALELSNVRAIREMVDMIKIQRSFETYQKAMQTLQDQDKLSTNRIGKL